jgi:hypothetical protein
MIALKTKEYVKLITGAIKEGNLEPRVFENFTSIFSYLEPHEKLLILG